MRKYRTAAAFKMALDDYFTFIVQQTDRLNALEDAVAVRYHVKADLTGRLFEAAVLDIGFMSPDHWQVEMLQVPNLLAFAEIDAITVPVIPLPIHIAEKPHAYTRGYSDGTRRSTREKDLVDRVLIAGFCPFDARTLRVALEDTFAVRGKQPLPVRVPLPPAGWGSKYRQQALPVGANPDVRQGHARVAAFLDPVLAVESFEGGWNHVLQQWVTQDRKDE